MRLRRAQNHRFLLYSVPHALATHYFLRLTRARRTRFGRRTRESSLLTFGTFGHTKVQEKKSSFMILLFQSSFRLSEKNEKDKKRNALTPVSATPTHMLRICVNPSFEHLLSPRGDRCEQNAPTVRQLLNHGYRFETLKRRLGFTAVPCRAMANLAVEVWVRVCVRT